MTVSAAAAGGGVPPHPDAAATPAAEAPVRDIQSRRDTVFVVVVALSPVFLLSSSSLGSAYRDVV